MLLYSDSINPRLKFITELFGKELLGASFDITSEKELYLRHQGPKINYSSTKEDGDSVWIFPNGLLSEQLITEQQITCFDNHGQKAFFQTTESDYPFDIFSASFYLLTRYEEYLPHEKDMYGRYAHTNSIAFKEGFLKFPLVNIWLKAFGEFLKDKFPALRLAENSFKILPTYDIDIAWSYKEKGIVRNAGGFIRDFFKGRWSSIKERVLVLRGSKQDTYDAYEWMNNFHVKHSLNPRYFFLLAKGGSKYDKNISRRNDRMIMLIKHHASRYEIGIHPSWQSGDKENLLNEEKQALEKITSKKVVSSRQHYIRLTIPHTFRRLIDAGILQDYSMGYGSINGFRASFSSPYYWYDLEKDQQTSLLLYPFCFMEANSFYEQGNTAEEALMEMRHFHDAVKSVQGTFVMIWHNSFLGTDKELGRWRDVYQQFFEELRLPGQIKS